jgi:hypothetical protein
VNTRIPILICIDVEPNERKVDPLVAADWTGFEKSCEFFNELRPRLEVATGSPVHFSWFLRMDPQVAQTYGSPHWVVNRYPRLIEELAAAGDEIGLHSHANKWDESLQNWFADYGNQEWIDHCLHSSFEAFQTSLDRECKSFRFGDHWMNNQTIDLLENLGVRFDLTAEFGAPATQMPGEIFTGAYPDYTRIPQVPYHPRKDDFTKRGFWQKRDLWIIPISAGGTALPTESPITSPRRRWPKWGASHQSPPKECMSLILAFDPTTFSRIGNRLLSDLSRPYLALPARTDFAVEPYQRVNLELNIEYLLTHPQLKDFVFETPEEAINRFN